MITWQRDDPNADPNGEFSLQVANKQHPQTRAQDAPSVAHYSRQRQTSNRVDSPTPPTSKRARPEVSRASTSSPAPAQATSTHDRPLYIDEGELGGVDSGDDDAPDPHYMSRSDLPITRMLSGKYSCQLCGRRLTQRSNAVRHLRLVHHIGIGDADPSMRAADGDSSSELTVASSSRNSEQHSSGNGLPEPLNSLMLGGASKSEQ